MMWSDHEMQMLYEGIFRRKSVRKLKPQALDSDFLDALIGKADSLPGPAPDAKVAFRLLEAGQLKGIVSAKAPHFLAVYADMDDAGIVNGAFQLQQLDLWLSANGIGTCWLGMPKPSGEAASAEGLPFLIALALGTPAEEVHRSATGEFKRKTLEEICDLRQMDQLVEPVRLAPSATNRQPWFLDGDEGAVRLHKRQANLIAGKMLGNMPVIDMGIALCHLWLSACHLQRFDRFDREHNAPSPAGHQYLWTVRLKG